jgi:diadenosine tetraphosphatase ApaH/serine/threonine PP2A family protein phosphatase
MSGFRTSKSRSESRAQIPEGIRIYAVGDIHGRADLLDRTLRQVDADLAEDPPSQAIQLFLGDYVDRGPASREVLDRLIALESTHRTVFLKGNHESLLTRFPTDPSILDSWQRLGGLETLMSYGITPSINADSIAQTRLAVAFGQKFPESHRKFLGELKTSFTCGDYFFVHAGVRPGIALSEQREEDLLWIRQEFLLCEDQFSKIVVHGHTPVSQPDIRPNRINIDTGAYATGRLTCLVLEADTYRIL